MMKVTVLGAGESGVGAAILAKTKGAEVWVSDSGKIADKQKYLLLAENIPFEEGNHSTEKFFEADLIIKSPGIPEKAEIMKAVRKAGKKVISEIEYAFGFTDARIIAITGSNGKTTTTSLIYHILKKSGWNVGLGGNIGQSFALQVAKNEYDYYVLELSSFQLDDIEEFRPNVAVITNITEDHLDRYDYSLEKYAAAKFNIIKKLGDKDYFIYNNQDKVIRQMLENYETPATEITFGEKIGGPMNAWQEGNIITARMITSRDTFDFSKLSLRGKHNAMNIMAAVLAVRAIGLPPRYVHLHLPTFQPIEHRIEGVGEVNGVEYINDSKATNVDSTFYALECMTKPVVWIAGGVDKGNDYGVLFPFVKTKVKSLVVLGTGMEKLQTVFGEVIPEIKHATSMQEAIAIASETAKAGECVLLSPCCASFDLFKNYEDRGNQFKQEVKKLMDN
jgi:UDP-N-acetylmuramoylalanine--D-glutamate ligase